MDKRIYELVDGASQLQINFTGLGTVIDNSNLTDAKFLKFSNLIKANRVVSTDSANNYSAVSPKSFLASIATETESGIIKYASDQEILDLSGSNAIQSSQIDLIWDAISSVGQLNENNLIQSSVPIAYLIADNIYYSSQNEISHVNGYLSTRYLMNNTNQLWVDFNLKPILIGSLASFSAFYIQNNVVIPLNAYLVNNNGYLRLYFLNTNGNWVNPYPNYINIIFQATFITEL